MARGLNKVTIIGSIGRDPEMRYTPNGRPVTSFSVAVGRTWTTADGTHHEEIEWFNVVAWGPLAEASKTRLSQDQQVYVEGRLQTRSWEDDQGNRHFRTEIVANDIIPLSNHSPSAIDYEDAFDGEEDDYPF